MLSYEELKAENQRLFKALSDQEKHNMTSRKSLCEKSDKYKEDLDKAQAELRIWHALDKNLKEDL